jgi:hypothetical protein
MVERLLMKLGILLLSGETELALNYLLMTLGLLRVLLRLALEVYLIEHL